MCYKNVNDIAAFVVHIWELRRWLDIRPVGRARLQRCPNQANHGDARTCAFSPLQSLNLARSRVVFHSLVGFFFPSMRASALKRVVLVLGGFGLLLYVSMFLGRTNEPADKELEPLRLIRFFSDVQRNISDICELKQRLIFFSLVTRMKLFIYFYVFFGLNFKNFKWLKECFCSACSIYP